MWEERDGTEEIEEENSVALPTTKVITLIRPIPIKSHKWTQGKRSGRFSIKKPLFGQLVARKKARTFYWVHTNTINSISFTVRLRFCSRLACYFSFFWFRPNHTVPLPNFRSNTFSIDILVVAVVSLNCFYFILFSFPPSLFLCVLFFGVASDFLCCKWVECIWGYDYEPSIHESCVHAFDEMAKIEIFFRQNRRTK